MSITGPYMPLTPFGGQGGVPFVATGWVEGIEMKVVASLDVWYSTDHLRGIQVMFSDYTRGTVFGTANETHASFDFRSQPVTSLTLWANPAGTRAGRMRLTTTNQTFDVGNLQLPVASGHSVDVGSGVLVGMMGRSGQDVDQLGAMFLRSAISRISITNIVYAPSIAGTSAGIILETIYERYFNNPANAANVQDWAFAGNESRTAYTLFNQPSTQIYIQGIDFEVSAESFDIDPDSSKWRTAHMNSTKPQVTTTINFVWDVQGELEPGDACVVSAQTMYGVIDVTYDSTVTVTLGDGSTNSFPERGQLEIISFSEVFISESSSNSS